jgi:hypothetical protein
MSNVPVQKADNDELQKFSDQVGQGHALQAGSRAGFLC